MPQNIRNNKNHARTPKWAQRYGLVDTSEIKRKERKSQWANRYNDRLPRSTLEGQAYEEGQEHGSSIDVSLEGGSTRPRRQPNGELWNPEDENYYNPDKSSGNLSSGGGRWHYPANFDDVEPEPTPKKSKKKKDKKDRWERTQDAYSMSADDVQKKRRKKKRKSTDADSSITGQEPADFPEDPEGGLYGDRQTRSAGPESRPGVDRTTDDQVFNHEF